LAYAEACEWKGVTYDPARKVTERAIAGEKEGVFRASGVLMGVRFVIGCEW